MVEIETAGIVADISWAIMTPIILKFKPFARFIQLSHGHREEEGLSHAL